MGFEVDRMWEYSPEPGATRGDCIDRSCPGVECELVQLVRGREAGVVHRILDVGTMDKILLCCDVYAVL